MYTVQSRVAVDNLKSKDSVEDSGIIGATIATLPSTSAPIWKQPKALEAYVDTLSRQTGPPESAPPQPPTAAGFPGGPKKGSLLPPINSPNLSVEKVL